MNGVWYMVLNIGVLIPMSCFLGYFLFQGFTIEENPEKRMKNFIYSGIVGVLLIVFLIGNFVVFDPLGNPTVTLEENGAHKKNREMEDTEPDPQKIEEAAKKRELQEWGEVNQKSLEEIQSESDDYVQKALEKAENQ